MGGSRVDLSLDLSQREGFLRGFRGQVNVLVVCGMEPIQFDLKAKFNGVSLHWKYRPLRKGNGRYIHAGRIPSSHKHRGVLIAGWYRGHYHRPEYGEASVVPYYIGKLRARDHHEITLRLQTCGYRKL